MKRVGSKNVMVDKAKELPKTDTQKKKGPMDWAQKRASKLILAPQPRLTEFKAVYTATGAEADFDQPEQQKQQISSSSLSDLVPLVIQRHLSDNSKDVAQTPYIATMQASCLFLDISSFTTISELLASESGIRGPEMLARSVNKLFTQLVRLVQRAGGDIFKFAGDAVIVLWPVNEADGETLKVVAHRAVQCAMDVQKTVPELKLDEFRSEKNKKLDLSFAFKCGVGVGTVSIVHLGGGRLAFGGFASEYEEGRTSTKRVLDPRTQTSTSTGAAIAGRREYIALGEPLKQAFASEKHATRHDIVVSSQTWSQVCEFFTQKEAKGRKMEGFVLIGEQKVNIKKKKQQETTLPQKEWMLTYVPRSAHLFLEVEAHTRKDWVSELRRVTVLFINMGVPKDKLNAMLLRHEGIETLHEYFSTVQAAVMDYEGSVNKFLMDDKGSTVIAVFGLPPISHENDATRGVLASLAISTSLQAMGAEPAVGVATGIAFCGVVGHPGGRREYTVLGDIVNLSARLMQRATEKQEGVLCDQETYYQAQEHLEFKYLKGILVKGKAKRVDVWQPHEKGFKTKRNLLDKALGVRKHRRRRSLDADWREQVLQFNNRGQLVMEPAEVTEYKKLMLDAREKKPRNAASHSTVASTKSTMASDARPKSGVSGKQNGAVEEPRHEDERDLKSDQFDELMTVLSDMHEAMVAESPCPVVLEGSIGTGKSRLLSRASSILKTEPNIWVLGAACNPFERGKLARPFGVFITLISMAIWNAHTEEQTKKAVGSTEASTLDEVPIAFRRMILMRWLASAPSWTTDSSTHGTKYLINEDFEVDFEEPEDEVHRRRALEEIRLSTGSVSDPPAVDMARNQHLIQLKAELLCNIFEGMCVDRRVVCIVDDALHLDSSSWNVALHLGKFGPEFGKGLGIILSSRPVTDFVLIDANSRDCFLSFKKLPGIKKLLMPMLPPRFVRQLALEVLKVDTIMPDIEIALEKAQGNPLFVRELVQSMMDATDVLDLDTKNKVAMFGKAAQMKLKTKEDYPECQQCKKRFGSSREKNQCRVCGEVVCSNCSPATLKRVALGYKEPVRCCVKCAEDPVRYRRMTGDAIEGMKLEPPAAIVCVIGTWIDKLTTKQQMVLKVACLLRQEMRFQKQLAFSAYPLDPTGASFELEFEALEKLGFVRPVYDEERDGPMGLWSNADEDLYEFCHNFLPDVLNQRVLESQREEMDKHVEEARARRDELERREVVTTKGQKYLQSKLKEGYLFVHKAQVGTNRKPWKQRWAVITGNRLELYYDRSNKTCAASCSLSGAKVFIEKNELSGRKRVIKLSVHSWEKRGKVVAAPRDFFLSPEVGTDAERDQWMYFLKMVMEASALENGRNKRGTSVTGWFRSNPLNMLKKPLPSLPSSPTAPQPTNDFATGIESSSAPRKSRGLELLLGRKKTSSSLNDPEKSSAPPMAAYQEDA